MNTTTYAMNEILYSSYATVIYIMCLLPNLLYISRYLLRWEDLAAEI